jgi:NADPH:quinone reductase-like Zn-dependent oxidoreductase
MNDCLIRRGFDFQILNPVSLPATPGSDVVGYIVEVGERVTDFAIGDRVACLVRAGGNARFVSVHQDSLVKVPLSLDSAEVASLISTYTTAYQAMRLISGKGPMLSLQGKKVLILGGLDGAGQALIQFCRKAKAEIFATAPKHRHIYLKSVLGVNPLPETDWLSSVTGQIDYVFDGVSDSSVDTSKALNHGGQLVRFGYSDLLKQEVGFFGAPLSIRMNKAFSGYTVDVWENFQSDPKTFKDDLLTLLHQLKWNKLKPHIAKRISLSDVAVAQKKLENGEIRGVIVCFPWRLVRSKKVSSEDS